MNKTWAVFKYEFTKIVTRRSFILALILIPLVPTLLLGLFKLIGGTENKSVQQILVQNATNPTPFGIVDQSGVIKEVPDWLSQGKLVLLNNEATARQQTEEGRLQGFYLFPADFLKTGKAFAYKKDISIASEVGRSDTINDVITYNLLGADQELYNKYTNPVDFTLIPATETTDTRDTESAASFYVPYIILLFFYILIISSASMMLNSVAQEKENRVMEILLSSAKPIEFYLGKLVALGLAALLQMTVWLSFGLIFMRAIGQTFSIADLNIPVKVVLIAIPFFIAGFAIYGSLMSGLGAIAPNLKEANQSTFVILLPLVFCMLVLGKLMQDPNGGLITFMSIFPLTSVIMMPTRYSIIPVPTWQVLLSVAIAIATAIIIVHAVANLFHAQTLLTGQKFKLSKFLKLIFMPHKA